jgi:hypothetical protein
VRKRFGRLKRLLFGLEGLVGALQRMVCDLHGAEPAM